MLEISGLLLMAAALILFYKAFTGAMDELERNHWTGNTPD